MARIYTRWGDKGETNLLFGGRVSKADLRCEAYGSVDEAVSTLGLARSLVEDSDLQDTIMKLQRELFVVGAELATDTSNYSKLLENFNVVTEEMVNHIEKIIDEMIEQIDMPKAFIIPGASKGSAALDVARTVIRKAERRVVDLKEHDLLKNGYIINYLNRLADLVFVMARFEDRKLPLDIVTG